MYRDHQSTQAILIEKLVSGKLPKQQFVDQESALVKKQVECLDKMNHITSLLRYVQTTKAGPRLRELAPKPHVLVVHATLVANY